jgi:hypothetical protein
MGVAGDVEDLQTETGVKDKITQFWITELLTRAKVLHAEQIFNAGTKDTRLKNKKIKGKARKDIVHEIKLTICNELMHWLVRQPAAEWDAMHEDIKSKISSASVFNNVSLRRLLRPGTHYNALLAVHRKPSASNLAGCH